MRLREPRLSAWPPLPPTVYLKRPRRALPFPFQEPGAALFAWGRHAVWYGSAALGLAAGDEVLMPAYHHGSEVELAVARGLVPRFYDSDERLRPRGEELEGLLSSRVKALHLTHFLGFPQDAAYWRRWCDERGLLLIEDAAQAWLASAEGRPVGSRGDLAFFCLYKTVGLPEGAVAVCSKQLPNRPLDPRLGMVPVLRKHAQWLAGRSRGLATLAAARRRTVSGGEFDHRDPTGMPWRSTMFLLRRAVDPEAAPRRRANYSFLLEALPGRAPKPFDELPAGAVPFAFPIVVTDKPTALRALTTANVRALDLWSRPHPALSVRDFPQAGSRRASVIALPVHQAMRQQDLKRMATLVWRLEGQR